MPIAEIVILAMIAAFLGLRLYSVLGRRAEHEEESSPNHFEPRENVRDGADRDMGAKPPLAPVVSPQTAPQMNAPQLVPELQGIMPAVERGLRDIAAQDRNFDPVSFIGGAKGAYEMVLEAFWEGDRATLSELCDDDVLEGFAAAIDAREAAGHTLENKLIRIEDMRIQSAQMDGKIARISVLFVADIAAVTRDKDGVVIAGSLDDAVESRDVWTFFRNTMSGDPNWLLDETDEG